MAGELMTVRWHAWDWGNDAPDPETDDYFETFVFDSYDPELAASDVMRQAVLDDPDRWDGERYILEIVHPESHAGLFTVEINREPQCKAEFVRPWLGQIIKQKREEIEAKNPGICQWELRAPEK